MGLHSENLFDHKYTVARHYCGGRHDCFGSSDRAFLRYYRRWVGALHNPHHHAFYRYMPLRTYLFPFFTCLSAFCLCFIESISWIACSFMSAVLLSPEASCELSAARGFHNLPGFFRRFNMCIYKR